MPCAWKAAEPASRRHPAGIVCACPRQRGLFAQSLSWRNDLFGSNPLPHALLPLPEWAGARPVSRSPIEATDSAAMVILSLSSRLEALRQRKTDEVTLGVLALAPALTPEMWRRLRQLFARGRCALLLQSGEFKNKGCLEEGSFVRAHLNRHLMTANRRSVSGHFS